MMPASSNSRQSIYIDAKGMRPDGTGSGFAWINLSTGERLVKHVAGLTNNVAEYRALRSALLHGLRRGAAAMIHSDSQPVVFQFQGSWKVRDPELKRLLTHIRKIITQRELRVTPLWISEKKNLAGKLL